MRATATEAPARSSLTLGTIVFIAILIGANYSVMQLALEHTTPLLLTGMRVSFGCLALFIYARFRGETIPRDPQVLLGIFLVSLCITTVSSMTLVTGVGLVPAGVAALLSSLVPVWTALLAFGFLREKLNPPATVGVVIGFIGAVVLSSPALGGETNLAGVVILLGSGFAWACGLVVMRWWDFEGVSPLMMTTVQLGMSAMVVVPIALVAEGTGGTSVNTDFLLALFYASVPATGLTFALMTNVARRASATQAASVAYLTPVFGVIFAWIIRNNTLSTIEWIGGALLIVGVVLVTTIGPRFQQAEPVGR